MVMAAKSVILILHWQRKLLKVGRAILKNQKFSIAKIKFLWRALKFKRGHSPPGPPFSATYIYAADSGLRMFECFRVA